MIIPNIIKLGLFWKMSDYKLDQETYKIILEYLSMPENKGEPPYTYMIRIHEKGMRTN
jgi:Na+/melibiose symporter-like transporter